MRIVISLLSLSTTFVFHAPLHAQNGAAAIHSSKTPQPEIHFEKLSVEHGLSQSTVRCLLQDRTGYIWLGTLNGLNKYDGYDFSNYRHNPNDPNSISSDQILSMIEDSDGDLWIGTVDGLNKFDRHRQTFVSYRNDPADLNSLSHNAVLAIYEDKSGTLWVGTALGLNRLDKTTGDFTRYKFDPNGEMSLSHNSVSAIFEDSKGNLWIGTLGGGLTKFNRNRNQTTHFIAMSRSASLVYTPEVIDAVRQLISERPALCSIAMAADSQSIARGFQVARPTQAVVITAGEGTSEMHDFGWLEKNGRTIWKMELNQTTHAGGAPKNRMQISILTLEPGSYTARYQSDDSHSFGKWNHLPPADPELWGIRVIPVSQSEADYFSQHLRNYIKPSLPTNNNISAILEDSDGAIWIGTHGGGLNKLEVGKADGFVATPDSQVGTIAADATIERFSAYYFSDPQYRKIYSAKVLNTVKSLIENRKQMAAILRAGDFQQIEKIFEIKSTRKILIVATGEGDPQIGLDDQGWISQNENVVWKMDAAQTLHAGGAIKNRIQIAVKTLSPGKYTLRFKSDDLHSFEKWNDLPPARPELWGIQIFAITDREEKQVRSALDEIEISSAITGNDIRGLQLDDAGALWMATNNGLSKLDRNTGHFTNFHFDRTLENSLSSNDLQCVLEDRSGVVWIGTVLGGVNKFSRNKNRFQKFAVNLVAQNGLHNSIIYAFCEDRNGLIWIGTRAGVSLFDRAQNKFLDLRRSHPFFEKISSFPVMAIHEDASNGIWIATLGQGLIRFESQMVDGEIKFEEFVQYLQRRDDPSSLASNQVRAIFEDSSGDLWIATDGGGLNRFDSATNSFKRYVARPDNPTSLSYNSIRTICEDRDGVLWIGTDGGGLDRFDKTTETFAHFRNEPQNIHSLSHNSVTSIHEQDSRYLWVATYGGGLNKFDKVKKVFERFTEKEGLPNNVIYSIVPDDFGKLWLSTNKGLSRFDPDAKTFKNYDMDNNLQSNEFNTGAYLKCRDGSLLFGGIDGFNIIRPEDVKTNPHLPSIEITRFMKFDQEVGFDQAFSDIDEIELAYHENFITFEFAALDYTNPHKNQYAYKLDGVDRDWIYCRNQRFATYTNLDPGKYTFRVKGSNNDGLWNESGASIRVAIAPPFWQTWWFASAIFSVIGFALMTGHKYRVKQKVKQSLELERVRFVERERVREQVSKDYHDELGHKLTKISLFSELIKRKLNGDSAEMRGYLDRVIKASESLSNETRDFIWTLNPGKDNVYDLALYLKEFGEGLFEETDINFRVENLPKELESAKLPMEWKRHLSSIFKEGMNNILRHSNCRHVRLAFTLADAHLQIWLEDDGVGLPQNGRAKKNGHGNGLSNMKSRAEEIAGKIEFDSNKGNGTVIRFSGKIPGNGYFV